MAFADSLRTLANQIEDRRKHVATEEAVKQALILPFVSTLGFDIYNPAELIPEYKAGWAKTTEKIDYCLQIHGKPILFIEAKGPNEALVNYDAQLAKYFNSTPELKFCIITNGIEYRFFTDLQEPNLLDKKPFFEFNFEKFGDTDIAVLERFRKDVFNAGSLVGYAEDLVFLEALKRQFIKLLRDPSDEFISFAVKEAELVDSRVTQKVIDRFRPLVKESISASVLEIVQQSLTPRVGGPVAEAPEPCPEPVESEPVNDNGGPRVETTDEELRAFELIKQIVGPHVPDAELIRHNDTERYFAIQYNVTTRWFARLFIQDRDKKIAVFRLPSETARTLATGFEFEDAPGGGSRFFFTSVDDLVHAAPLFVEAAKTVIA